jgi:hypothetical protein
LAILSSIPWWLKPWEFQRWWQYEIKKCLQLYYGWWWNGISEEQMGFGYGAVALSHEVVMQSQQSRPREIMDELIAGLFICQFWTLVDLAHVGVTLQLKSSWVLHASCPDIWHMKMGE